jgi:hypothetical protein
MRDRRAVWRFAVFYVSGVAVLFAMFVLVTHGRFLTVLSLTFSGEHSIGSALGRPITLLYWFPIDAAPIALLLPFAVIAVAHGLRSRHLTPWQLSLIAAAAILLIIWTDVGVDSNHLVDIVVLISLVAGERWARNATTVSRLRADRTVTAVLLVALPWGMLYSYDQLMDRPVRDAVVSLAGRTNRWSLQELRKDIPHGSRMLAEDATVPLILGRQPVVEDAFMVPPIGRSHPEYLGWLVRQVEDKDFDEIVLEKRIDRAPSWWYGSFQFGPQVIDAVATNYRFEVQAGPYFVYTPRR